jgi:hypothetical protein
MFGPLLLITVGILFLLANMGFTSRTHILVLFATWWPVLLILLGVVRMVEYTMARRNNQPAPRFGGGAVFLLILFLMVGLSASGMRRVNWQAVNDNVEFDDDVGSWFGDSYDFNNQQDVALPAGYSVHLENGRGSVKVTASADDKVHISSRRHIRAESQEDAAKLNAGWNPDISTSGQQLRIILSQGSQQPQIHIGFYAGPRASSDVEIAIPKKAVLDIVNQRGDVDVSEREGDVRIATSRGDISIMDVKGNADLTSNTRADARAHNVTGDVLLHGRYNDTDMSDVAGTVDFDGDFFGSTKLSRIGKRVRFHTSRTDMEFASLQGDLYMDRGELRANALAGPFRLNTKAKDVHLEDVSGDVNVENANAEVEIHPKSPYGNVVVQNSHGAIRVVVPPSAGYAVEARVQRGDLETDFDLQQQSQRQDHSASGNIGKGSNRLQLSTDRATIEIRKG